MTRLEDAERKSRLWHVHDACRAIMTFAEGVSLETYRRDRLIRSAIEREFIVIGEALRHLGETDPEAVSITNARKIVAFRNQLVHNYPHIDDDIVWTIVRNDIPDLARAIEGLLSS